MCEALTKSMEPEFSRAREEARKQGFVQGREQGIQNVDSPQNITSQLSECSR